ncbi:hypothetical protein PM082_022350 [Marasmius tenuissimus]|nr:hypothetical protein PM082_022350 [Marasmius tenuissimus]
MQFKSFVVLALSTAALAQVPLAAVYDNCVKPNTAAVTFDDGPYNYNFDILTTLKKNNVKATFFFNGNNYRCIYDMDTTVRNVVEGGHQMASHTWSHPNLKELNRTQIEEQMSRIDEAMVRMTGLRPAFVRPPYGEYNDLVREVAAARGQSLVNWSFDSGDSAGKTAQQSEDAYAALLQSKPSTIIALNHETQESTAKQVIAKVILDLIKAGYTVTTVADCLGLPPYINTTTPEPKDPKTWKC